MDENEKKKLAEEIAVFRHGVIADLVRLRPGTKGLYALIAKRAEEDFNIPGTNRTRVAAETIRDWIKLYRRGGFDALVPGHRRDAGSARAIPREVVDQLLLLREENAALTIQQVIDLARDRGLVPAELPLAYSTVHRLLARHAHAARLEKPAAGKDHRRFAFQKAGDLWMSDVMHGPAVMVPGKGKRKTYLIAFLDDATRVIPFSAFATSENTTAFLPVLKQAVMRRGIPQRLFVDNGAAYRSHQLALVCAKLGISLIHARAYHPEAKGKQERWFRTVRTQLLPLLSPNDTSSLDALNRRLWAYVEGEYHQAPHRGLDGETPLDRWGKTADEVKYPGPGVDLDDICLFEAKRKVHKDRTVSLDGAVYEVDATLVGESVTLRYDPARPGRPVQVWAGGKKVQDAKIVDTYANCFVKRDRPSRQLVVEDEVTEVIAAPTAPASTIRYAAAADREEG
ncbi:DDE-type integrase/transposase/recombinase [Vulgatibacter sp.]|uniref:DDE-type integrase/transposase/recombinase n=1 Tax=Vulgatibacter sp. TaxID=1971226 RepID=UPI003567E233